MYQVNSRHIHSPILNLIQLGYAQTYWIIPMRRPGCKDSLLCSLQLWRLDLGLLLIVVVEPNMKNEYDPHVAKVLQTLQTT